MLQVQLPTGQWPANGDNTRQGYELGIYTGHGADEFHAYGHTTPHDAGFIHGQRTNSSWLIPGYGGVALRERDGPLESQVNIDSFHLGWYGHTPTTVNNLQLSAFGHTMLDLRRYERTRYVRPKTPLQHVPFSIKKTCGVA